MTSLLSTTVESMGYEFVGYEFLQSSERVLRIYLDKTDGVNVDDCAKVSRQLSAVLDVEDPIPGEYHLEVSSPGLDRPLFTLDHYARFLGSVAKVRLGVPLDGRRSFKGTIVGVVEQTVQLSCEGQTVNLPFADIEKARLVAE